MSLLSFTKKQKRQGSTGTKKARAEKKPVAGTSTEAAKTTDVEIAGLLRVQPLLTEKTVALQEHGVIAFRVPKEAGKREIAQTVEQKYRVGVIGVRTMQMRGKSRRRGTSYGRTAHWKKAYVQVDDVQKISAGP